MLKKNIFEQFLEIFVEIKESSFNVYVSYFEFTLIINN